MPKECTNEGQQGKEKRKIFGRRAASQWWEKMLAN